MKMYLRLLYKYLRVEGGGCCVERRAMPCPLSPLTDPYVGVPVPDQPRCPAVAVASLPAARRRSVGFCSWRPPYAIHLLHAFLRYLCTS